MLALGVVTRAFFTCRSSSMDALTLSSLADFDLGVTAVRDCNFCSVRSSLGLGATVFLEDFGEDGLLSLLADLNPTTGVPLPEIKGESWLKKRIETQTDHSYR